jgi:hypothetical protein
MKTCCAFRCALAAAAIVVTAGPAANAVETVFDITGAHSNVDGGCVGPTPVFSGIDCSYDASSPVIGGLPWAGPGFAAGYYATGTSPFVAVGLGTEPAVGDGKFGPAVSGTVTVEDNGTPCDTDDTIAVSIALDAATRAFSGGPGTRGEESWADGGVAYAIAATTVDAAAANGAGGCDWVIGSAGELPPLLERADGMGFFPPEESIDAPGFYVAPATVGVASFEGNPNIGANLTVTTDASWSCVESPAPGAGPCNSGQPDPDDDGANFLGSRAVLENALLAVSTDAAGDITSGVLYAFNESKIFNVPPDPFNSWDGPVVQFVSSGGGGPAAVANDDAASTLDGQAVDIDVLGNDTGFTDPVTVTITTAPGIAGATAVVNGSPGNQAAVDITYTPAAGSGGMQDTFDYQVDDGTNVDTATVTVDIQTNALPVATDQTLTVDTVGVDPSTLTESFDAATAAGNDPGNTPATASTDGTAANGTDSASGTTVSYTPDADFFAGSDSFGYTIMDATGDMATAQVTVDIPDADPVLDDASGTTDQDAAVDVDLGVTPGNGSPDQHTLSVSTDAANGSCTLNGFAVTYTPDAGFAGSDQCTIMLADGDGSADDGVVTITVNATEEIIIKLPGGSSALDLASLSLLLGLPLLRRRRRR